MSIPQTVEIDSDGPTSESAAASSSVHSPSTFQVSSGSSAPTWPSASGDEVEKQALLRREPEVFFPLSTYDWPLVMVRLEAITGLCK